VLHTFVATADSAAADVTPADIAAPAEYQGN
jgi:hypothetical protein